MENNVDEKMKRILGWKEEDIKSYSKLVTICLGKLSGKMFEKKVREIQLFAETITGTLDDKLNFIKEKFPEQFE
ncbi:MAG: hypothetical protein NTX91_00560 [candidate division SR1 bacterium]|nr:hypothetical protein [candidate division SR1 bacterium]